MASVSSFPCFIGLLFFLEGGGEPDAVFDYYGALGSGLAVGPAGEAVAGIWDGAEDGGVADVVVTVTGYLSFTFNLDIDGSFKVGLEDGLDAGVVRGCEDARVVGAAIGPAHEAGIVDAVGLGIDGQVFTGSYLVFARLRVKGSENGLVDGKLQFVLHEVTLEDGVIGSVVLDRYLTGGGKPFVIFPVVEVAVILRNGLERDLLADDVAASALHIAVALERRPEWRAVRRE